MRFASLRREPAIAIIVLALLALIAGILGMWSFQHGAELQELHQRLTRDANEMVRQMEVFGEGPAQSPFNPNWIPLDLKKRLLEVRTDKGDLLYRSPRLVKLLTADRQIGLYEGLDGHRHRMESFRAGGLLIFINAELDPDDNFLHEIGGGLLLAIPAMFVIIVVGGLWLRDRALRPVQSIRENVTRVTAQSLDQPLAAPVASAEITQLVSALNITFKSLSSSFEQAARFSADASHQLKTPLAVLRLGIEELLTDPNTSLSQQTQIEELLNQIHRLTSIVEKLLLLSRADAGRLGLRPQELPPSRFFSDFLDDIAALSQDKGIELETCISAGCPVLADPDSVAMILENLMENAIKYNRPNGRIKVTICETSDWTEVSIVNTSEPIPKKQAAHIFKRFVRGSAGEDIPGTGLGLSIARELAEANHGHLDLVSSANGWTEFRLRLPRARCEIHELAQTSAAG
jgi:signal transduction histidine kinase